MNFQLSFICLSLVSSLLWSCNSPTPKPDLHPPSGASAESSDSKVLEPTEPLPSSGGKKPVAESPSSVVVNEPVMVGTVPVKEPVVSTPAPTTSVPTAEAANPTCTKFAWETIKSPDDALCFKSIDGVFASLPERIRPNWMMMRKTRSAQTASLEKPRIIVAAPDGSFVMGAATDQQNSKDFEIAVFDYKKNVWDFAGIDFTQTPPKVERELCKTCHGSEPHPIWTEYPNWTGAFADQSLLADEAAVLTEMASGKSTLPFVKHLIMAKSYKAKELLYPETKYYVSESNQTFNIAIALRAARQLTSKLLTDKSISETELLKIAGESLCDESGDLLKAKGYRVDKELNHGIVGVDREEVVWSGNASGVFFVGIEILNQLVKKNPDLKNKISPIAKLMDSKEFKFYQTEGLTEFFAAEDALKGSWGKVDNSWLRSTFRPAFKNSSSNCKLLGY